MRIVLFFFAGIVLLTTACTSSRKASHAKGSESSDMAWVLKFNRGPCFGTCPVYTFYLLADHSGLLEVRGHFLDTGWYHATLDQENIHYLLQDIEPDTWWNSIRIEEPMIQDMPVMSLTYKHIRGWRQFVTQGREDHELVQVTHQLDQLVQQEVWTKTKIRPLHPEIPEPTDVIVHLREGVDVQRWMEGFKSFGIEFQKRLTPRQSYYLVSKTPSMGSPEDFINTIKSDPNVIDAQWDRPVLPRDR